MNANKLLDIDNKDYTLKQSDLLNQIDRSFDLIISNPPYVSPYDYQNLDSQIIEYEPKNALYAEQDGYEFYQKIISTAKYHLNPGGAIVFEIGSKQQEGVMALLKQHSFKNIHCQEDLAQRPRVVYASWH